jgi:hypothetical protein
VISELDELNGRLLEELKELDNTMLEELCSIMFDELVKIPLEDEIGMTGPEELTNGLSLSFEDFVGLDSEQLPNIVMVIEQAAITNT